MPPAPFLTAAAAVLAALAAAAQIGLDPGPLAPGPAVVLAVGLGAGAVTVAAATVVSRARWARAALALLALAVLALAAVVPLTALSIAAAALAGIALAGALGPWLRGWLRRRPAAGAPPRAGALALGSAALLPVAVAAVRFDGLGWGDWVLAATGCLSAWALSRSWTAGLWAARLGVPAAGITAWAAAGLPDGPILTALALAASAPAWHPDVGLAVRPLVARPAPIPPELSDPDLLRAAGYDHRGRPLEEHQ